VSKPKQSQAMKPSTAAQKLEVYLPATPREFQEGMVTREEFNELQRNPPQWLADLRRDGPHPRGVVAARLRVSNSGLTRAGITGPLTTVEIAAIIADPPPWLGVERGTLADTRREERRVKEQREEAARRAAAPARRAAAPARGAAGAPRGRRAS
jgi:hypothetical protein